MTIEESRLKHIPVSEDAIVWAYRLILGRDPENADIVRDHLQHTDTFATLRKRFLGSSEFLESQSGPARDKQIGVEPPCLIQTDVDAATADKLVSHIAQSWNKLGETEPYWSVLSEPEYAMENIGETRVSFLESGRFQAERLFATLRRCGFEPDPAWDVFELGCGLGRITRWLAQEFRSVLACDISASHLELARQINADAPHFSRIRWEQLKNPRDIAALPAFDLFFSVIVLQHNPPPVIATLLEQIAAGLRMGGIAFFQVPTYHRDYYFEAQQYFRLRADTQAIEMHVLPQAEVFRIFLKHGCVPLEVYEDEMSGSRATQRSNTFVFRKIAEADLPRGIGKAGADQWGQTGVPRQRRFSLLQFFKPSDAANRND